MFGPWRVRRIPRPPPAPVIDDGDDLRIQAAHRLAELRAKYGGGSLLNPSDPGTPAPSNEAIQANPRR